VFCRDITNKKKCGQMLSIDLHKFIPVNFFTVVTTNPWTIRMTVVLMDVKSMITPTLMKM
jgi:hypothetical protein